MSRDVIRTAIFILFLLTAFFPAIASAQTDDDDCDSYFDSTLEFTQPPDIDPETQYQFVFTVTNAAKPGTEKCDWIQQVDLTMPSADYAVDKIDEPNPLHQETENWESYFDANTATITWSSYYVNPRAMMLGDIREGESLSFSFTATTDSQEDGTFIWLLTGDEGNSVAGESWFDDDDDVIGDDDDDDDAVAPADDDQDDDGDDDGGNCGC
jgi:hypothetical protein